MPPPTSSSSSPESGGWATTTTGVLIALLAGGMGAAGILYALYNQRRSNTQQRTVQEEGKGQGRVQERSTKETETRANKKYETPPPIEKEGPQKGDDYTGANKEYDSDETPPIIEERESQRKKENAGGTAEAPGEGSQTTEPQSSREYVGNMVKETYAKRGLSPSLSVRGIPQSFMALEEELRWPMWLVVLDDEKGQRKLSEQPAFSRAYDGIVATLNVDTIPRKSASQTAGGAKAISVERLLTRRLKQAQQEMKASAHPHTQLPVDPKCDKPAIQQALSYAGLDKLYAITLAKKMKSNALSHPDWAYERRKFPYLEYLSSLRDDELSNRIRNPKDEAMTEPEEADQGDDAFLDSLVKQLSEGA
eukprot:gb/GECG01015606.1/.p1 GENE.gb/GECG01015606.1/~~gb/GECG01015606.1/.p1  ORF type:complete len:364 (+),score=60.66 gb/GECG01015606.1/:1-1092(+)